MKEFDVTIIGAGVIGGLIAYELAKYDVSVLLIDKENDVANATTMANSAIVHSGYDPKPGTKKAYFNVKGNAMFPKLCKELDVPFNLNGSLTVARSNEEILTLEKLANNAALNGVEVSIITKEEVHELEPNLNENVLCALLAKSAGVVNPFVLTSHAIENAITNGLALKLGEEVTEIQKNYLGFAVKTTKNAYQSKVVINCAGVYGDKVAKMIEPDLNFEIKPRKGEYLVIDRQLKPFVTHTIFPLPNEKGKGILVVPLFSTNFLIGPSSDFVDDKEDLSTDSLTISEVKKEASSLINNIPYHEVIRVYSGLRATPSTHDFYIETAKKNPRFINVIGIESPGLASSPAIAKHVVTKMVKKVIPLDKKEKDVYIKGVKKRIKMNNLSDKEADKIIKKDPRYADIVCSCEKVSLGEILDELNSPLPPKTVKTFRKRLRVGFGKCQGGFCQAKIIKILANFYNVKMTDILYDKDGSNLVIKETKVDG